MAPVLSTGRAGGIFFEKPFDFCLAKEVNKVFKLNQEQFDLMAQSLVSFVLRVAADKNASPAEIAALPEIAKVLCRMSATL